MAVKPVFPVMTGVVVVIVAIGAATTVIAFVAEVGVALTVTVQPKVAVPTIPAV